MSSDLAKENQELKKQLEELKQNVLKNNIKTESTKDKEKDLKPEDNCATIIVLGASGDLAKKMTFPALFCLYCNNLLPKKTAIYGYARSDLSQEEFHKKISEKFKCGDSKSDNDKKDSFLKLCKYFRGKYDQPEDFAKLNEELDKVEDDNSTRVFYLAIPPTMFVPSAKAIREKAMNKKGGTRIIIEKPYGKDLTTANLLTAQLNSLFRQEQIYIIDHFLGKEMVQNVMALRFANVTLEPVWNRNFIASVFIDFKENFGAEGRGGYFDEYGIIRDMFQNHLIQIMTMIAMECPVTMGYNDVANEKVKILREICPINFEDVIVGQYTAGNGKPGYTEDKTVKDDSLASTFAAMVLYINNDRWRGVPFIIRCGKALDTKYSVVRIQFHESKHPLYPGIPRNELVIQIGDAESIRQKYNNKIPGMQNKLGMTELNLTYKKEFTERSPGAYERLLHDVLEADHTVFVREDEAALSWKIFDPILAKLESEKIKPVPYKFGSAGPKEAETLIEKHNFKLQQQQEWEARQGAKL